MDQWQERLSGEALSEQEMEKEWGVTTDWWEGSMDFISLFELFVGL